MRRIVAVIAVTLAAGGLARDAMAAEPPPVVSTAPMPPDAHTETPLGVRPGKPLTLQEPSSGSGGGWKILALAGAAGLGLWLWKRRGARPTKAIEPTLSILRRTTIGIRSELLVVQVEGQRLLIGVTPNAIQTLATLASDSEEDDLPIAAHDERPSDASPLGDRFASILASAQRSAPIQARTRATAPSARAAGRDPSAPVEGQARGLLSLGSRE